MDTALAGIMRANRLTDRLRESLGGVLVALLCVPFFWFVSVLGRTHSGATDFLALPLVTQLLAVALFALPFGGLWLVRLWLRMPPPPDSAP
jgi:hypothetical protein